MGRVGKMPDVASDQSAIGYTENSGEPSIPTSSDLLLLLQRTIALVSFQARKMQ